MGEILFLAHRVPFPPDRGDKIRSHHLLKGLAKLGPVHVGTFGETSQDMAQKSALALVAKTHALIERTKPLPQAGIEAVLKGKPVSLTAFDHAAMRRYVAKTLGNHRIDTIFVFSGQMGQYIPDSFEGRVVFDMCDVDSAKFAAYAEAVEGGLGSWIEAAITCPVEYDGTVASIPRPELDEVTIGAILTTRPRADGRFAIPAFETIHTNLSAAFPKLAEAARARLAGDAA